MPIINGRGRVGIRKPNAAAAIQIVSNGLILYLDAGKAASYPGTGTTWADLSGNGNNGTLTNGPTYNSANSGSIVFDGVDDICTLSDVPFRFGNTFTISIWFYWDNVNKAKNMLSKRNASSPFQQFGFNIMDSPYLGNPSNKLNWFARPDTGDTGNGADTWLSYSLGPAGVYNAVVVMSPNNQYLYVNGVLQSSSTKNNTAYTWILTGKTYVVGGTTPTLNMWNNKIYANLVYNRALTSAEVLQNFNALAPRFYPIVSDADAQAFVVTAGLTSSVQASAINTLVTSLKSAGIWTKMKAVYPFVGGSAASHKWNLKDPRDLDAAFRLNFAGTGWVHSSTGAKPSGVGDSANTFFVPNSNLPLNSMHMSTYIRTHSTKTAGDMGCQSGASNFCTIWGAWSGKTYFSINSNSDEGVAYTTLNKFHVVSRTAANSVKLYRNNVATVGTFPSTTASTLNVYIGAVNYATMYYSDRETGFASIGEGLSDAEASSLYTIVQAYQTALGRQV